MLSFRRSIALVLEKKMVKGTRLIVACVMSALAFASFGSGAKADIRVELPRSANAEELASYFDQAAQNIGGLMVTIERAERYFPGSVRTVTEETIINMNRVESCFFFFTCSKPPHYAIILKHGMHAEIVVQDYVGVRAPYSPHAGVVRTSDEAFQRIRPQFENLLLAVFSRMEAE